MENQTPQFVNNSKESGQLDSSAKIPAQNQVEVSKHKKVSDLFESQKLQIQKALPKHLNADRMIRMASTELRLNPALLDCDATSLIGAVIQASQLGLEIGGVLGQCYLVPFNNNKKGIKEVQFITGFKGLRKLALNTGKILSIEPFLVREGDQFYYEHGLNPRLEHIPLSDEGNVTHAYAVVTFKPENGNPPYRQFRVLTRKQLEKARSFSKTAKFGPWVDHEDAMFEKTAVRRVCKDLELSPELQQAIAFDEMAESGISQGNGNVIEMEKAEGDPATGARYNVRATRSRDEVQKQSNDAPPVFS